MKEHRKFVSVVIPCFNEEDFIVQFINNLKEQDYPSEFVEYLILDGMSTDRTRDLINKNIQGYTNIVMYDNLHKTQPYAMNIGIEKGKGDIILRMDVHCHYPVNYVSELVKYLVEYDVDNVGAALINKASSSKKTASAISLALGSAFCVGNSEFRITKKQDPYYVDTVPFGCFNKSLFAKIGLFDESLPRCEDNEFNSRILKNGGKILLIPSIRIVYYTRDTFTKVSKMFFQYGLYKPLTSKKIGKVTSIRQIVPLLFICYLVCFPILNIVFHTGIFILPLMLYFLLSFISAVKIKWKFFILIMYTFLLSHIFYGVGYIMGIANFVLRNKKSEQIEISR